MKIGLEPRRNFMENVAKIKYGNWTQRNRERERERDWDWIHVPASEKKCTNIFNTWFFSAVSCPFSSFYVTGMYGKNFAVFSASKMIPAIVDWRFCHKNWMSLCEWVRAIAIIWFKNVPECKRQRIFGQMREAKKKNATIETTIAHINICSRHFHSFSSEYFLPLRSSLIVAHSVRFFYGAGRQKSAIAQWEGNILRHLKNIYSIHNFSENLCKKKLSSDCMQKKIELVYKGLWVIVCSPLMDRLRPNESSASGFQKNV